MPGVIEVPQTISIGKAIEDLLTVLSASNMEEWDNQVVFLPL
jgi:hypothetical protein